MAFNGSGTFVRLYNWVNDAAAGIKIRADRTDNETDGIATGLSNCICKDGQTTVTANIPFNSHKLTGVADGTLRTDVASVGQTQDGDLNWVAAGGTADAITATYSVPITALIDGQMCYVRAGFANATTTPTFAPSGLTARTITKNGGVALVAGDIVGAGHELALRYKLASTRWELLNPGIIVTAASTNTLTNKSIDLASNTLTGTLAQFNTACNNADFASIAGSETLTNKTLTTPIISSISNTGTLTLPTSSDTLVGKATTDTLTNKTFDTAGTGNSFSINGVAATANTGTGAVMRADSATATTSFTTPKIIFNSTSGVVGTTTNDNAAAGSVGEVISATVSSSTATVTITIASPGVVSWTAHGLSATAPVVFTTTGALPTGITAGTVYYVTSGASLLANSFQISTSVDNAIAGTSVNTSGSQSGVQTGTAAAPLSNAVTSNILGISLTAGDWDVYGDIYFLPNATTSITILRGAISQTSATLPSGTLPSIATPQVTRTAPAYVPNANSQTIDLPAARVSLAGTTTIYLVARATFSVDILVGYGLIWARRAR